jgi:hypothetical protein
LFRSAGKDRRTLRAEELSGDVEGLAAHNNDLLAIEQLLRDRAGQATEQVALSVNDLAVVSNVLSRRQAMSRIGRVRVVADEEGVRTMTGSKVDMVLELRMVLC